MWVRCGQPLPAFETATLREVRVVARGAAERAEDEMQRARILNQELAQLVGYAFHDPKKMPDLTRERRSGRREMSQEETFRLFCAAAGQFAVRHNAAMGRKGAI